MHEARYWIKKDAGKKEVQCLLCPHVCVIPPDKTGLCRVRRNQEGSLVVTNYARVTAAALDPVEKKPLKRFMPGQTVFSLGTFGCNLACGFCQNWTIAHGDAPDYRVITPREAVEQARRYIPFGNIGIAYTYSEPLMWFEYVLDTAKLVREAGLKNVLVTNGYINPKPLQELLPYIDAVNLDVKAFTGDFYSDVCKGKLDPVLRSARLFAESCHLEITTLLVTGLNDSPEEVGRLAEWIASLDQNIPLHLTRYFPNYKMKLPATPLDTLIAARETAGRYLTDVFLGNV